MDEEVGLVIIDEVFVLFLLIAFVMELADLMKVGGRLVEMEGRWRKM